jgi:hypothetical protein
VEVFKVGNRNSVKHLEIRKGNTWKKTKLALLREGPKLRNEGRGSFNDFKTIVHLVGFSFIVVIADARNHEPET